MSSNHYDKCDKALASAKANAKAHFRYLESFMTIYGSRFTANHKAQQLNRLKALPRWVQSEASGYHDGMLEAFMDKNIVHGTWHPNHGFLTKYKSHPDYEYPLSEFEFYEFVKANGTGLFYSNNPHKIWFADKPEWIELNMTTYINSGLRSRQ